MEKWNVRRQVENFLLKTGFRICWLMKTKLIRRKYRIKEIYLVVKHTSHHITHYTLKLRKIIRTNYVIQILKKLENWSCNILLTLGKEKSEM